MFMKSVATVFISATLGFLSYIAYGVIEAKALSSRVDTVEMRTLNQGKEMSDFKSLIKEDIGYIKGQNETIINLLQRNTHTTSPSNNNRQ